MESTTEIKSRIVAALRQAMRPIVRMAIASGISYSLLSWVLKRLYVDVAERDFALPFKRQTDSRVALLTGISRKDVSALRRRGEEDVALPEVEDSVATHAVGRWMAGPPSASPDGNPRRLRYESDDPREATFSALVRQLSIDIPVRAVLDELIRLGSVELGGDGEVRLVRQAHIPGDDVEGKLALLGSDPAELFSTIVHNLDGAGEPWLQRKVVYDNIGSEALQTLREESRRAGEEFVRKANALVSSFDRDRNQDAPAGHRSRVSIGVYYFEDVTIPADIQKARRRKNGPPGRIQKKGKK